MKIGIIGNGRMGRAVRVLAEERGHDVIAVLDENDNPRGAAIASGALNQAEVAIEFTHPESAVANAMACLERRVPVVIGTTGWYDQLNELSKAVEENRGSVLWAPNFAVGVVLLTTLVRTVGELFGSRGFAAHQIEMHHERKVDAPSGTARALAQAFEEGGCVPLETSSVRVGSVPGTHEIHLDGPFEHIRLEHQARDRRVFADGALQGAEWLKGREGMYTMHDVLGLTTKARGS